MQKRKKHTITILRNQLLIINIMNQDTFKKITWFQKPKNYN